MWRGRRGSRDQWTLPNWLHLQEMEGGMNLHGTRKLDPNCRPGDDLVNLKWANIPGCKLSGVNLEWKAPSWLRVERHILAKLVGGGFCASVIGGGCVLGHRTQEGGSGPGPGVATTANEGPDRGAKDFLLQGRKKRRLATIGTLE